MAIEWSKVFSNWTWHNKNESRDTPVNATNLQKINDAIDTIDTRVVTAGTALNSITSPTYNSNTKTLNIG